MSAIFGDFGGVTAAARQENTALAGHPMGRILRPNTGGWQWLMPQLAAITPQYLQMTLAAAAQGSHVQQAALFRLMLDTWPELAACVQELAYAVARLKLIVEPFADEDEQASDTAQEKQRLVSAALRGMRPQAEADENDIEGTIRDLVTGWICGVSVLEIDWQMLRTPKLGNFQAPRATWWAEPHAYGMGTDGRIGLLENGSQTGGSLPASVRAFPEHKFLLGIHKAQSGTPFGSALLRPLAWWWCAANFSADWLLNLAQIFGLPFRWANYDPQASTETVSRICSMLQNMGSAGWAAFPAGTTMELKDAGKTGDHSPQGELLDRADRYARLLLLGQTQSGGKGSAVGGQAFGTVESEVKTQRIDACGRYVCGVLNTQLVPSIVTLNYGAAEELPCVRLLEDEEGGLEEAQRDEILSRLMPLSSHFLRKKYGQPEPQDEEDTAGGPPEAAADGDEPVFDPEKDIVTQRALWREKHKSDEKPAVAALERIAAIEDDALFARALEDFSTALAAADADGVWRTIGGHPVFIKKGQSVEDALQKLHGGGAKTAAKKSDKTSTSEGKKETIYDRENPAKRTAAKPAEGTARDGTGHGSHAERTTRDELARAAGANTEGGLKGSYDRQTEALAALREKHPALAVEPSQDRKIGAGAEHHVEQHHADATRVMKHTTDGFGVTLHPMEAPFGAYAKLRNATPQEYIARIDAQNHLFGDDTRIEGITKVGDRIGLAVSQRAIQGGEPSAQELAKFMKSKGFVKVKGDAFDNDYIADKVWFHPQSNHVVADVKPDNFKKDAKGRIIPIDVLVQHAAPGTTLHRAVFANLEK